MSRLTPYYADGSVTLYLGDYRDVLPSFAHGMFGAVVTDPPYGDTSLSWDRSPARGWLANVRPFLAPCGSVWFFASLRYLLALQPEIESDWQLAQDIVWEKHNGSSFHADRFKRVHEFAVQLYPDGVPWESVYKAPVMIAEATKRTTRRKGRPAHTGHIDAGPYTSEDGGPKLQRSVIYERSCHGHAVHPTQKPEGIVRPLLLYSATPTLPVLDIFAGSATTLAVAKSLRIPAVGIERDESHCARAAERLSQTVLDLGASA
jgi:site-specific DNA-methyltransferase (adenine-specific)